MSHAFLGRITRTYADLSGMLFEWSQQCDSIWVYQHDADEKVNRTHCHIFALGSQRDADGLKKLVSWKSLNIEKGNSGSSFKTYNKLHDLSHEGEWYWFLAYCSKGHLDPVYANGANANEIANESKKHWQERSQEREKRGIVFVNEVEVKKPTKITLFQIARLAQSTYMCETGIEQLQQEDNDRYFDGKKMINIVIRLLKANRILAHKRTVANIIQDIRADLSPNQFVREVLSMI